MSETKRILLAEDNKDDLELTLAALEAMVKEGSLLSNRRRVRKRTQCQNRGRTTNLAGARAGANVMPMIGAYIVVAVGFGLSIAYLLIIRHILSKTDKN